MTDYTAPVSRSTNTDGDSKSATDRLSPAFSHPKNAFGVPLAIAAEGDTGALIKDALVGLPGRARDDAEQWDLITVDGELTHLGSLLVDTVCEDSTPREELAYLETLKGDTRRFADIAPERWRRAVAVTLSSHDYIETLRDVLVRKDEWLLKDLAYVLEATGNPLASLFLTPDMRGKRLRPRDCTHPDTYRSHTTYQMKSVLYHAGILTERGRDTSALDPAQDVWALESTPWGE